MNDKDTNDSDNALARYDRHDLLSHKECEEILEKVLKDKGEEGCCGKLLHFKIVPDLSIVGYLGEYFHLYLSYQLKGSLHETRVFVKTMPYQNPAMMEFIEKSGILKKEAILYENLLNELRKLSNNIWCARCYLTKTDLFVMQNMNDLGYAPPNCPTDFLDNAQMMSVLKTLATMHACSIGYEQKFQVNIGDLLKEVLYEVTVSPKVESYTAGIRAVLAVALEHPTYRTHPVVRTFIQTQLPAILDTVYEMVEPSSKYRNVFCHRDIWGGNVFFSKLLGPNAGAVLVDFQLCRYSPAAIDVLMALYINMRPQCRKAVMRECCRYYYDCFKQELSAIAVIAEDHMSFKEFEEALKEFALFGALYNCIAATILRVPGDYLKSMKLYRPKDFHRYTNVERTEEVLQLVKCNADFREYMFECIDDMLELVLGDDLKR